MDASSSPARANASVLQLDRQQLNDFVMPQVRDMADNVELLERARDRRFDRDEPPPYRSPTPEDEGDDDSRPVLWPTWEREHIIAELDALVSLPLNDKELQDTQRHLESFHPAYSPGRLYEQEAKDDYWSVVFAHRDPRFQSLQLPGHACEQQGKILVRHRIRKRWERLGVWNPEWGIPGRPGEGPRDKTASWRWAWQGDTPTRGAGDWQKPSLPDHPNTRAVRLRQGLHRGQRGSLPPRRSLTADSSKSAAESFITSRPWYTLRLDEEEERTRLDRIPSNKRIFYDMKHDEHVRQRWDQSGEWKCGEKRPSWKWKHESPSPEPPDLDQMDFTPSEIDALEAVPPPPPPPKFQWDKVFVRNPDLQRAVSPDYGSFFSGNPKEAASEALAAEPHEAQGREASPTEAPPPRPKRGRPRGRRAAAPKPPETGLRRSARIAENQRQRLAAAAPQTGQPTKSKKAQPPAAAGASAAAPRAPPRRRGRPPKAPPSVPSQPRGVVKRGRPRKASTSGLGEASSRATRRQTRQRR